LSEILARIMSGFTVSLCITLDEEHYKRSASSEERAYLGNACGFAGFACSAYLGDVLRALDHHEFGFYVDQGGRGTAKHLEILQRIYADDRWRARFGLADFGPADRRVHLPVHTADLVVHEVITNRHHSHALSILGQRVIVRDLSKEEIDDTLEMWRQSMGFVRRHQKLHGARTVRLGPKKRPKSR
jgi:hypothetical protein